MAASVDTFTRPLYEPALRIQAEPYDPNAYQKLPLIVDAMKRFDSINGEYLVSTCIRQLFLDHKMDRTFGLIILHRHFDMAEHERLVEYGGTSVPWELGRISKNITATNWLVGADGMLRPYEFSYAPAEAKKESELDFEDPKLQAFLIAFQELVGKYNASGLWGLCRYPGDDFTGRVEVTEGRANINLRPEDYPKDMESRVAAWFFFPPLWELKCNCGCRYEGSKHSHQGHRDSLV